MSELRLSAPQPAWRSGPQNTNSTDIPKNQRLFVHDESATGVIQGSSRFNLSFDAAAIGELLTGTQDRGISIVPVLEGGNFTMFAQSTIGLYGPLTNKVARPTSLVFTDPQEAQRLTNLYRQESKVLFRKVYYDVADLQSLLLQITVLRFFLSIVEYPNIPGRGYYTLTAVGNSNDGAKGRTSLLPCPPNCGSGGYENDHLEVLPAQ